MKTLLSLLILPFVFAACSTPAQNAKLARIVDVALVVAEKRGAISTEDAAAVREAKTIVLDEPVEAPAVIVTTSGK
jgi:hypothetical protein